MEKEKIIKKLIFNQNIDTEINDVEFYLRVKGVAFHQRVMTHLGVDFNDSNSYIEWVKVSALLRYDKKLRDKIYIYLATLEEYIRAYLSNKYENEPVQPFWKNGAKSRHNVKTRILNGENIFDVLQSIEFGHLLSQVENVSKDDINEMFDYPYAIHDNLGAVKELRNAVSHHVFLMDYKFMNCVVNGINNNTLEHNIKNLRQLLPKEYRFGKNGNGGITADIDNCKYEKANSSRITEKLLMKLDSRDIVNMN